MKIRSCILASLLVLLPLCMTTSGSTNTTTGTNGAAQADTTINSSEGSAPLVFVIPVEDMIERGLLYVVRRSIEAAVRENATAIILDMNTPGGRVDVAEEIMRMLIDLPDSIRTITYVNKDALSAGSLISISTERIYMTPGSRIGASAIVTSSGDIEEGDMKEKHVSALVALARSAAENAGHDPNLVEAMIRRDYEYKIGDEVICPSGQLLTLTDRDAARVIPGTNGVPDRPLLAVATVDSFEALKQAENLQNGTFRTIRPTFAEQIARYIEQFAFIFLAGGLLGIYIEFKTPGFGFPGLFGGVMLAIFFWGHRIAGLSGDIELVLFAFGLLLLLLELFVIPGFGLAGFSGITLILTALFFSMVRHAPAAPTFHFPTLDLQHAAKQLGLALGTTLVFGWVAARFLPRTQAFQHLVLSKSLTNTDDPSSPNTQTHTTNTPALGATGSAITPLHPAGFATVEGRRINVVARGDFINPGEDIVIAEIHGNRIVVDKQREPINRKDEENAS